MPKYNVHVNVSEVLEQPEGQASNTLGAGPYQINGVSLSQTVEAKSAEDATQQVAKKLAKLAESE